MKRLLSVCLLLLLPLAAGAQTFTLYTSANSDLPFNSLYDIAFDNYGNIWFAGQKDGTGLAQVSMLSQDLSTWTVYDPSSAALGLDQTEDRAFYIGIDYYNTKWFCTHYGLSYAENDGTAGAMLIDDYTRTVFVDRKGIIYVSDRDLETIEVSEDGGATWTSWGMADIGMSSGRPEVYDIDYDGMGRLWICTYYGVFYRELDGTWQAVADLEGEYTYGMALDLNDNAWVPVSGAYELYQIAPDGTCTVHDSTTIEELKYPVNDIAADCNGHIWCATGGGGLLEIRPDGSHMVYTAASTNGQLPSDNLSLVKIHCGVIWVATAADGVVRLPGMIGGGFTDVSDTDGTAVPSSMHLYANYPNPFNPVTTILFELKNQADITLTVYDVRGRLIQRLLSGVHAAGTHRAVWDGRDMSGASVSSGVYIYQLKTEDALLSRKMMLMK